MNEIKAYLNDKKRTFKKGIELYNKFGKEIVPQFDQWKRFFEDVKEGKEGAAPGILETKLNYILRLNVQTTAKKKSSNKAVMLEEDMKAEDPNTDQKAKK